MNRYKNKKTGEVINILDFDVQGRNLIQGRIEGRGFVILLEKEFKENYIKLE